MKQELKFDFIKPGFLFKLKENSILEQNLDKILSLDFNFLNNKFDSIMIDKNDILLFLSCFAYKHSKITYLVVFEFLVGEKIVYLPMKISSITMNLNYLKKDALQLFNNELIHIRK